MCMEHAENHESNHAEKQEVNLEQRMYELMRIKNKSAYSEWKKFFDNEFTEDADISSMKILLDIARAYPLQGDVIRLIVDRMAERAQSYHSSDQTDKALLASEIVKYAQAQIPKQNTEGQSMSVNPIRKSRTKPLLIGVIVMIVVLSICGGVLSVINGSGQKEACKQAAEYLNEKYGDTGYTEQDLEADKAYLYGDAEDKLTAYYIYEKDSYNRVMYAISEKGKSDYICFDNLQEKEIKQAFQKTLNEITGQENGKLLWNSSAGSDGAIEDGYFHTKYDGAFDSFIEEETAIREKSQKVKAKRLYGSHTAKNGNCDYYLPDLTVETVEQRLTMEEMPENQELQALLEESANKYEVQIRGIVLPKNYFDEKIKLLAWNEREFMPQESIYSNSWMQPAVPFLLMTGWYVNLPKEDADLLDIQNGMYAMQPVQLAEGIYGVQTSIDGSKRIYTNPESKNSFSRTETPESLQLSNSQKKTAVSICYNGKQELEEFTLAINKTIYGIPDNGYRVYVTRIEEDGAETEELTVSSYMDKDANLRYGDALDGEGYLFLNYDAFWDWEEAPVIITIVK